MEKGQRGFKEKPVDTRKTKHIVISDPNQVWFKKLKECLEKNSNVLYPDEQSATAFLRLCIKYGDACVEAINRQRFAFDKRQMTIAKKKAEALKALEESGDL